MPLNVQFGNKTLVFKRKNLIENSVGSNFLDLLKGFSKYPVFLILPCQKYECSKKTAQNDTFFKSCFSVIKLFIKTTGLRV